MVCDDERDQRYNTQAFALVHFLIEQRLTVNRLCVVDSTALTPQARRDLLDLAKKYQVPTTLILFNTPLATCLERDAKRERSVGSAVIERQYEAFEQSKAAIRQEGFDQIVEYQDRDLEKVQVEILFRPVVRTPQRSQRPDAGGSQRLGRPAQPSLQPSSGPRDGSHSVPVRAAQPLAPPPAAPRPATASASAPNTVTPRAAVPAVQTPPSAIPPPPAAAKQPNVVPQASVPPKPASPGSAQEST